jgi:hypothetical protein
VILQTWGLGPLPSPAANDVSIILNAISSPLAVAEIANKAITFGSYRI